MNRLLLFHLLLIPVFFSCTRNQGPWVDLFNGTDFTGFHQLGGEAVFSAEYGIMTGTSVPYTPNSFMVTDKTYGDFILEFKVKIDTSLNSGVQLRSDTYTDGMVHGYQVEIENDQRWRLWSGGLFEEKRRGWLNRLSENEAGRKAFKSEDWNHYRVEAIGSSIKTWVNGVMCANLVDEFDSEGFIGFQVHGIPVGKKPWTEGKQVRWKDIRIMTEDLETYRFSGEDPVPVTVYSLTNALTVWEKEEGWELLFDGKSTDKWRGVHREEFPDSGWRIENGTLHLIAEGGKESEKIGDIVTIDEYIDFEFHVDFKLSEGADSGIKYYVTEKENKGTVSGIGLEYQLLDDATHMKESNRTLSSLYDLISAEHKHFKVPGKWNQARIVSEQGIVKHYLNGFKVLEYQRGSEEYLDLVANSKYRKWKDFGEADMGHILLQDYGHEVWFRNIKIRRLNP